MLPPLLNQNEGRIDPNAAARFVPFENDAIGPLSRRFDGFGQADGLDKDFDSGRTKRWEFRNGIARKNGPGRLDVRLS
ncbi:MAG TPA: hypothetical protein VGI99_06665, partial [Gemmataceae bacterium]